MAGCLQTKKWPAPGFLEDGPIAERALWEVALPVADSNNTPGDEVCILVVVDCPQVVHWVVDLLALRQRQDCVAVALSGPRPDAPTCGGRLLSALDKFAAPVSAIAGKLTDGVDNEDRNRATGRRRVCRRRGRACRTRELPDCPPN